MQYAYAVVLKSMFNIGKSFALKKSA